MIMHLLWSVFRSGQMKWCNEIFEILDRMGDCLEMRGWLAFRYSKLILQVIRPTRRSKKDWIYKKISIENKDCKVSKNTNEWYYQWFVIKDLFLEIWRIFHGMSCQVMYQSHYSYFPYQRNIVQENNKQVPMNKNLLITIKLIIKVCGSRAYNPVWSCDSRIIK